MGCWAEHQDGSLIFVESTEDDRVIYSMFDVSRDPPVEYRDAMPNVSFKRTFSWDFSGGGERWTWHDKTPFPWHRVIKAGIPDGGRLASARDVMTAAERVAASLRLRGEEFNREHNRHRAEDSRSRAHGILDRVLDSVENWLK